MTDRNAELMDRIASLAGAINRHNQNISQPPSRTRGGHPYSRGSRVYRGSYRGFPARGGGITKTGRGGSTFTPRNRTLVIDNKSNRNSTPSSGEESLPIRSESDALHLTEQPSNDSFVSKRDRHMQIINKKIYPEVASARAKAIDEAKKSQEANLVDINNVKYLPVNGGKKLIPNDPHTESPPSLRYAGNNYIRSRNGNLWRQDIVHRTSQTNMSSRSIDKPCKFFTMTGSVVPACTCKRGLSCPYRHDPEHVALCKHYLHGKCSNSMCDLSHHPTPHNSPICLHFLRGSCTNPNCLYTHMRVNPQAKVCKDFALLGYCDLGSKCKQRHVFECPDFEETGNCPRGPKKCKLAHIRRAGKDRPIEAVQEEEERVQDQDSDQEEEEEEEEFSSSDDDSSRVNELENNEEFDSDEMENTGHDSTLDPSEDYIRL